MHIKRSFAVCLTTLALACSAIGQSVFPIYNGVLKNDLDAAQNRIKSANLSAYTGKGLTWDATLYKFNVNPGQTNQPAFTGNQDNYVMPSGRGYLQKWSTATDQSVTGVSIAQTDGQEFQIVNEGPANIVLANENTSSTDVNRFRTDTGSDVTIPPDGSAITVYDNLIGRWRVSLLGGSGGSGGGGGSGTVTSVTTGPGLTGGPITTSGTLNLANVAPQAHKWFNGIVGNVLTLTRPDFTDLTGQASPAQLATGVSASNTAIFGDGSGGTVWRVPSVGAIIDPTDQTKQAVFDISSFLTGTTNTIAVAPGGDSVTVIPNAIGNVIVSPTPPAIVKGINADGTVAYGFPDSGTATLLTNKDNYSLPTPFTYQRWIATPAPVNVTGIAVGQVDGETFNILNTGPNAITIKNESANSSLVNRFHSSAGGDIVLGQDQETRAVYDATLQRWRVNPVGAAGGTVTSVGTGPGLTGGPITGSGTLNLANVSAVANQFVDSVAGNVLHLSQPAFSNLSGSAADAQLPVTLAGHTLTDTNAYTAKDGATFVLENTADTTKKAQFDLSAINSGVTRTVKVANAPTSVTVIPDAGSSHNFLTAISTGGAISKGRPVVADLTDLGGTSRLIGSGSAAATASEITLGSGLTMTGTVLSASGGGGGTPGGSDTQLQYNNAGAFGGISTSTFVSGVFIQTDNAFNLSNSSDSTKKAVFSLSGITTGTTRTINVANATSTTVVPNSGASNQWVSSLGTNGQLSLTQPAFSNISGTATNAQLPATLSSKIFDDTNTYTAKDGSFTLENSSDATKKAVFDLSNVGTGTTKTVNIPNAASTTVQADTGASNNFLTAISAQGVISKSQPAFSNLSGTATNGQLPATLSSKTFDNSNTYIAKDGNFTFENSADTTKQAVLDLSNITTGTSKTINVPNANSTLVQPNAGSAHNFVTAINAQGVLNLARPASADLSDGPSGAIVGTTDSQALTNKDLTGSGNTFPTFNQNTTGSAAKLTTARNIGGVSFDGTADIVPTNISGGNATTLLGSIPYQSNTDTTTQLGPNTTTTKKFLRQTGTGTNGAAPAWDTIAAGDVPTLNQSTTGSAATLTTARNLWGQSFNGSADVTGSLTSVGNITGGASSMTITAGTGNSRTLALQSTTSGGTATTFLTGNADQSVTLAAGFTAAGASTIGNNAMTVGTLELNNDTATTLSGAAGVLSVEGVVVPTISSTNTLTNKAVTPQVQSVSDAGGTFTPVSITNDMCVMTALSQATTIAAPTGSPVQGEKLLFRIKDNGTARALTWTSGAAGFRASSDLALPTTTTLSKTLYCLFVYNSTDNRWDLIAKLDNF